MRLNAFLAGICLGLVIVIGLKIGVHVYHAENAGIVLWNCGPGFEFKGNIGFFVEECK